jgi:hypothetical protein
MLREKLSKLTINEIKGIIRSYNYHTKIIMTGRKKEQLIDDLIKHLETDMIQNKVKTVINLEGENKKVKEEMKEREKKKTERNKVKTEMRLYEENVKVNKEMKEMKEKREKRKQMMDSILNEKPVKKPVKKPVNKQKEVVNIKDKTITESMKDIKKELKKLLDDNKSIIYMRFFENIKKYGYKKVNDIPFYIYLFISPYSIILTMSDTMLKTLKPDQLMAIKYNFSNFFDNEQGNIDEYFKYQEEESPGFEDDDKFETLEDIFKYDKYKNQDNPYTEYGKEVLINEISGFAGSEPDAYYNFIGEPDMPEIKDMEDNIKNILKLNKEYKLS